MIYEHVKRAAKGDSYPLPYKQAIYTVITI